MNERLDPLNDFVFKKIFGEKGCEEELKEFLNAILDEKLNSVEIIENTELTKEMILDRTGRLDVRAITNDGNQIDIEVQLTNKHNMDKRTLFYWGKLFLDGIKKGEDFKNLSKVITINILDFNYLENEKFHSKFHLWEDNEPRYRLTDIIEIHFIEMKKFIKYNNKDLKNDSLQRWLSYLNREISNQEREELLIDGFNN